jgi:ketosteroid isomerase-like protein
VLQLTRRAILVTAAGVALCSACQTSGGASKAGGGAPAGLSEADLAGIRATDSAFAASATAGDLDGVVAAYASDAALLPPNLPPQKGRNAIRAFWGGFLNAYTVRFEIGSDTIEGRGDLAYNVGHYRFTAVPKAKADPGVADEGKFLEVLKKQSDGSWKYIVDMYSSNLTPQH